MKIIIKMMINLFKMNKTIIKNYFFIYSFNNNLNN